MFAQGSYDLAASVYARTMRSFEELVCFHFRKHTKYTQKNLIFFCFCCKPGVAVHWQTRKRSFANVIIKEIESNGCETRRHSNDCKIGKKKSKFWNLNFVLFCLNEKQVLCTWLVEIHLERLNAVRDELAKIDQSQRIQTHIVVRN